MRASNFVAAQTPPRTVAVQPRVIAFLYRTYLNILFHECTIQVYTVFIEILLEPLSGEPP